MGYSTSALQIPDSQPNGKWHPYTVTNQTAANTNSPSEILGKRLGIDIVPLQTDGSMELLEVTPDFAEAVLSLNFSGQRSITADEVSAFVRKMDAGEWDIKNKETIKIGADGTLYDGQHRLAAAIYTICPPKIWFIVGPDKDSYKYLDSGRARRAEDIVSGENSKAKAAIGRRCFCFDSGSPIRSALTGTLPGTSPYRKSAGGKGSGRQSAHTYEVAEYCEQHEDELERILHLVSIFKNATGIKRDAAPGFAFFLLLSANNPEEEVEAFSRSFNAADPNFAISSNSAITALVQYSPPKTGKRASTALNIDAFLVGSILWLFDRYQQCPERAFRPTQSTARSAINKYNKKFNRKESK